MRECSRHGQAGAVWHPFGAMAAAICIREEPCTLLLPGHTQTIHRRAHTLSAPWAPPVLQ